jgi:hypothetical protein
LRTIVASAISAFTQILADGAETTAEQDFYPAT